MTREFQRKNKAILQLEYVKGSHGRNLISKKPSVSYVAKENASKAGKSEYTKSLFKSPEARRQFWLTLAISAGVVILFYLALRYKWIKL